MNNGKITKDNKVTKTKTTNNNSKKPSSKHLMTGTAIFIAAILVISGTNMKSAYSDTVNTVNVAFSGPLPLQNGQSVTATYQVNVQGTGVDGEGGCNANTASPLSLTVQASSGLTPSTSTVQFTNCGVAGQKSVTFTSNYQGTTQGLASIRYLSHSDSGPGAYTFNIDFGVPLAASTPTLTAPKFSPDPLPNINNIEATSSSGATVTFGPITASDEQGSVQVSCTPTSGSTFALGTTTVTCSATNTAGTTQRQFTVTVVDTTAPELTLPGPITQEATGPTGATVTYTASANDAVAGAVNVDCNPASGSTFALGDTTVQCSATDGTNTVQGQFVVTVKDTTPPKLEIPGPISAIATSSSGAVVTYIASATDLVAGVVPVDCSPASGSTFPLKTTTVQCSATDGTNPAQGSFVVTVSFPQWSGLLQPINTDGSSVFKQGSTVPVKFQIPIPNGGFVTDAVAKLYSAKVSSSLQLEGETEAVSTAAATTGNLFRYDSTSNQYIFNLGTKSLTAGTYQLRIDIGDLSTNTVVIGLKK